MNINGFSSPVRIYLKFYAVESTLGLNPTLEDSAILLGRENKVCSLPVLHGPSTGQSEHQL